MSRFPIAPFALTQFLASIRDRLGTAAVKGKALDLCQELFVADGARSDEEEAVLQNLRKLSRSGSIRAPRVVFGALAERPFFCPVRDFLREI